MRWGEKPSFLLSLEQSLPLNVLVIVFCNIAIPHISWWSVTIFLILYLFAYILFLLLTYFTWIVQRSHRNYANRLYLYAQEEKWNGELLGGHLFAAKRTWFESSIDLMSSQHLTSPLWQAQLQLWSNRGNAMRECLWWKKGNKDDILIMILYTWLSLPHGENILHTFRTYR